MLLYADTCHIRYLLFETKFCNRIQRGGRILALPSLARCFEDASLGCSMVTIQWTWTVWNITSTSIHLYNIRLRLWCRKIFSGDPHQCGGLIRLQAIPSSQSILTVKKVFEESQRCLRVSFTWAWSIQRRCSTDGRQRLELFELNALRFVPVKSFYHRRRCGEHFT